jgi:hypothetical protein
MNIEAIVLKASRQAKIGECTHTSFKDHLTNNTKCWSSFSDEAEEVGVSDNIRHAYRGWITAALKERCSSPFLPGEIRPPFIDVPASANMPVRMLQEAFIYCWTYLLADSHGKKFEDRMAQRLPEI